MGKKWSSVLEERIKLIGGCYCEICHAPLATHKEINKHHLWPEALKGENKVENCQLRCKKCEKADPHWLANNQQIVRQLLRQNRLYELSLIIPPEELKRLPHSLRYYRGMMEQKGEFGRTVINKIDEPVRSRFFNKHVETVAQPRMGNSRFATARFG